MIVKFTVQGEPKGKGRPCFSRYAGAYTPAETAEYEDLVKTDLNICSKRLRLGMGGIEMSREILFRGKRKDNGEWVDGDLRQDIDLDTCYISGYEYYSSGEGLQREPFEYEVDPETVGQYTGLTDKNGKKVFEGDIIRIDSEYAVNSHPYGRVFYETKSTQFLIAFDKNAEDIENVGAWINSIRVIGNIHDNSELLK